MANEKRLDLISRQALIAEYDRAHIGPPGGARKLMEDAPTVDAVEVVHGRWLNTQVETGDPFGYDTWEIDVFVCSVCGVHFDVSECRNYCSNCGAKMDGDGNV